MSAGRLSCAALTEVGCHATVHQRRTATAIGPSTSEPSEELAEVLCTLTCLETQWGDPDDQ